jgi:hypothetical protein
MKPFDKSLHDKFDALAKRKAIQWFARHGVHAIENPDQYGVDLIVPKFGYCEVEMKAGWKNGQFPFPSLHLPYRKLKFAKLDRPTMFIVWNAGLDQLLWVEGWAMSHLAPVEIDTRLMKKEKFFDLPLTMTRVGN